MALKLSKTKFGQDFNEAYVMISKLIFSKPSYNLEAIVKIYPDENSRTNELEPIEVIRINKVIDNINSEPNFFVVMYDHLKTLPGYESAEDLL